MSTHGIFLQLLEKFDEVGGHAYNRPCDLFDVIAGIGTGGWLAIFLGRFQMSIGSAIHHWKLMMGMCFAYSGNRASRPHDNDVDWNEQQLITYVDKLTKHYKVGDQLIDPHPVPHPDRPRCRYVFVAARQAHRSSHDRSDYNLFRSYEIPPIPELLNGSSDPTAFRISHAFAVTGATPYFSRPWEEHIAAAGNTRFLDTTFPRPHNITLLALQEMWTLFGNDVPISVIVNIGPGFPPNADLYKISRRSSLLKAHLEQDSLDREQVPASTTKSPLQNKVQDLGRWLKLSVYCACRYRAWSRRRLLVEEGELEDRVREQLRAHSVPLHFYHRLAPKIPLPWAAQDDYRKRVAGWHLSLPEIERSIAKIHRVIKS